MENNTQTLLFKEINYFKYVKEMSSPLPPLVETIHLIISESRDSPYLPPMS